MDNLVNFIQRDRPQVWVFILLYSLFLATCANQEQDDQGSISELVGVWSYANDTVPECEYLELEIRELVVNDQKSYYWSMFNATKALYQFDAEVTKDSICLVGMDACVFYDLLSGNRLRIRDANKDLIWYRLSRGQFDKQGFYGRKDDAISQCIEKSLAR